ncbi:MAG: hypothetical protein ACOH1X_09270 [Kaistella sp.]
MNNKIFYCVACIYLIIKGGEALLDLVFIKNNEILNNATESLTYKIGLILGMIVQVLIYFSLMKILFQNFIMTKSLKELDSVEQI